MTIRSRWARIVSAGASAAIALSALLTSSAPTAAAPGVELSTVGQQAFQDVTTCLTSGKTQALDVFYLVDNSGSLSYTDENEVRQTVLENSVSQLSNFSDQGVKVSLGAALFSKGVQPVQSWKKLSSRADFTNAVSTMHAAVNNSRLDSWTNWEAGLTYAEKQLASRPAANCKILIWFTDGGINPDSTMSSIVKSLRNLCRPTITADSLGVDSGKYGLFSKIKNENISVFGILYQNDASTLKQFNKDFASGNSDFTGAEHLALEHYLMSYMTPLVEGSGTIANEPVASENGLPAGGPLKCADVNESGMSKAGVPNGAFLNAQDPVALALQFLKLQSQISGGRGSEIVDGKFDIPAGTAAFRILTSAKDWKLEGPSESGVAASSETSKSSAIRMSRMSGVNQIDFKVDDSNKYIGKWKFDSGKDEAQLFLFSGLTVSLDRDISSQVISDRPNTLTGQAIRTADFASLPIDLSRFEKHDISIATSDSNGSIKSISNVQATIDNTGQFKIDGYTPPGNTTSSEIWLTLDLGSKFQVVTSKFTLAVVPKSSIAVAKSDVISMTPLVGPKGLAQGSIVVQGPTTVSSATFCFAPEAIRTSDAQTAAVKHERAIEFKWKFNNQALQGSDLCVDVRKGETKTIAVSAANPIQADAHVVSIRGYESTSGAAKLGGTLRFEFDSKAETNALVEWLVIALLLALGILGPLGGLYLFNKATTKFGPTEALVRAEYPVLIEQGASARLLDGRVGSSGGAIQVSPTDFVSPGLEARGKAAVQLGSPGLAQAVVPLFPLNAPWFEQVASPGNRVISVFNKASKNPDQFADGRKQEISSAMVENWLLTVPESEFLKDKSEKLSGTLTVFAAMGQLADYQSKLSRISNNSSLKSRLDSISNDIKNPPVAKKPKRDKATGSNNAEQAVSSEAGSVKLLGGPGLGSPPGASAPTSSGLPSAPGSAKSAGIIGAPGTTQAKSAPSVPGGLQAPGANPTLPPPPGSGPFLPPPPSGA